MLTVAHLAISDGALVVQLGTTWLVHGRGCTFTLIVVGLLEEIHIALFLV